MLVRIYQKRRSKNVYILIFMYSRRLDFALAEQWVAQGRMWTGRWIAKSPPAPQMSEHYSHNSRQGCFPAVCQRSPKTRILSPKCHVFCMNKMDFKANVGQTLFKRTALTLTSRWQFPLWTPAISWKFRRQKNRPEIWPRTRKSRFGQTSKELNVSNGHT